MRPLHETPTQLKRLYSQELDAKFAALQLYLDYGGEPLPFEEIDAADIDLAQIQRLDVMIVPTMATFDGAGGYIYDDHGESALAFVIVGADGETEIDIVAWPIRHPDRSGTLLHRAAVIGAAN